jgi:hypothetical protein
LTGKHFGDDELPFPKWCPIPDIKVETEIIDEPAKKTFEQIIEGRK